ncbi:hypothetical protein [Paenibacillus sp. FJAT-27812]|uniref:hypothetical protein n=1 Tax=Paenibacillus sp. FJAT-27812 TaxID=1684143 RepID=UPI0006A7AA9C|nr:hypothetical protein [Paenibacillus sp. FJAT-27812]
MRKGWIAFFIIFGLVSFYFVNVSAETTNDVSITVNSEKEQYAKNLNVDLSINFNKKDLYNEKVFLSYHLYDKNNQELSWEGQRFPITINENGISNVNMSIDLMSSKGSITDYAIVRFDLVDEKNVYWFSTNPEIKMTVDEIVFKNNYYKKMVSTIKKTITTSPITFSLNVLFFIVFIILIYKIRMSQLFKN